MDAIFLSREQEKVAMDAIYDFVVNTIKNSKTASPAELAILPGMAKLVFDYWGIPS